MRRVALALTLALLSSAALAQQVNDIQLRQGSSSLWGATFNANNNQVIDQFNTAGSVVDSFRWYQGTSTAQGTFLWSISPTGHVAGAATGGRQGAGTINATGLFINGAAVVAGGTVGGSSGQVQYNNAGVFGGITGATSNGTTLTLVAPILGTPASGTLTNTTGFPVANLAGAGTGVLTALGVNIGSAGAPVLFNGAGGTPSSLTLTNATGLPVGSLTGLSANCPTWLATASSANLRSCMTDETGTGVLYFQGGDLGTPSAGVGTNLTALNATQLTTGTIPTARLGGLSATNNSLSANVALNNIGTYFDGPTVAQGSTGTWYASGTVTVTDTAGQANINCRLWDGSTIIASARTLVLAVNTNTTIALSGFLATPAGNLRISCQDVTSTSGLIVFNASGQSRDSTISAFRIN